MTSETLQVLAIEPLEMAAPKPLAVKDTQSAVSLVPALAPATEVKVDAQLDRFLTELMTADVGSEAFQEKLQSAFRLGRKEIAEATELTSTFASKNFVGEAHDPAFQAIAELRNLFDELNPANQGDLLAQPKVFGMALPFGNRLKTYLRKFESAETSINKLVGQLRDAEDLIQKDAIEIESVERKILGALDKLKAAQRFAEGLDARLSALVEETRAKDALKARALEQEVLVYARQSVTDILTQQTISVNTFLSMGILKKTAKDLILGCDRLATHGKSALYNAVVLARATGNQIRVQAMQAAAGKTIGDLILATSEALGTHAQKVGEHVANPLIALEALQKSVENTMNACDTLDNFRSQALLTMSRNNEALRGLLSKADTYVERNALAASALKTDPDAVVAL